MVQIVGAEACEKQRALIEDILCEWEFQYFVRIEKPVVAGN
jgi:hypothetical protein